MCSINDADLESNLEFMEKSQPNLSNMKKCKKCREETPEVVLRLKDAYCRKCFLADTTHKFRAALGKSKLIRPREKILLAYSGSASSSAMLHLVHTGRSVDVAHKRFIFEPHVLFVDEGSIYALKSEERVNIRNQIYNKVKEYQFPVYVCNFENILKSENNMICNPLEENSPLEEIVDATKLKNSIDSIKTLTARNDYIQKLRYNLILKAAQDLNCTKVFMADTSTDLAIKTLTNVSLGRGAQLALDIGFCDTRCPNVQLLRPMFDFMHKEIVYYNVFYKIESLTIINQYTKREPSSSIQKMTEQFVTELQESFPSTVSTIIRTGRKLSHNEESLDSEQTCSLCYGPLDTLCESSSALQATEFSRLISSEGLAAIEPKSSENSTATSTSTPNSSSDSASNPSSCCGECSCDKENELQNSDIVSSLCYGCRLIFREMDPTNPLPSSILTNAKRKISLKQMRKEIEDFLL